MHYVHHGQLSTMQQDKNKPQMRKETSSESHVTTPDTASSTTAAPPSASQPPNGDGSPDLSPSKNSTAKIIPSQQISRPPAPQGLPKPPLWNKPQQPHNPQQFSPFWSMPQQTSSLHPTHQYSSPQQQCPPFWFMPQQPLFAKATSPSTQASTPSSCSSQAFSSSATSTQPQMSFTSSSSPFMSSQASPQAQMPFFASYQPSSFPTRLHQSQTPTAGTSSKGMFLHGAPPSFSNNIFHPQSAPFTGIPFAGTPPFYQHDPAQSSPTSSPGRTPSSQQNLGFYGAKQSAYTSDLSSSSSAQAEKQHLHSSFFSTSSSSGNLTGPSAVSPLTSANVQSPSLSTSEENVIADHQRSIDSFADACHSYEDLV